HILVAVEDLLGDPESQRRDAGCDRSRPRLIAVLLLLLFPPLQLVLAIAHDDGRARLAGSGEGLGGAIAVAALIDDADDVGERGKDGRNRLLCRRLIPVALDRADDLELGMSGNRFDDAVMDRLIDRGAGKAADFEQVSALRLELRHLL